MSDSRLVSAESTEREFNENTNGLIRQFFPKQRKFDMIMGEQLKKLLGSKSEYK